LRPLKTGAARVALGFLAQHPNSDLKIVPVGLNYMNREKFRSKVLVSFGAPITVDSSEVQRFKDGEWEPVKTLTDRLQKALESLTVNAPDWATLR
jgi:glycerol-3-phosphate O-acyltransferase/dihydroxyacetone phosphate acyltransferase